MARKLIRINSIDDIKKAVEFYNIDFVERYINDANKKKLVGTFRFNGEKIDKIPEGAIEQSIILTWYKGKKLSTCETVAFVVDLNTAYIGMIHMKNERTL